TPPHHSTLSLFPYTTLFRSRTVAVPLVGYSRPESIFSVVVLPAPFGPRNPTSSPSPTMKLTSFTATVCSYLRWKSPLTAPAKPRSEEHTSELQSRFDLVCRL